MAGGGGSWKVAYADFVTAMMAFFLVMWITGQNDEVKVAISGYFEDPWGSSSENSGSAFQVPSDMAGGMPSADSKRPKPRKNAVPQSPGPEDGDKTSRWKQEDKIHFINKSDRSLPALLVRFEEASAELSELAKEQLKSFSPEVLGKLNKIEIRAHSTQRPLPDGSPFGDHWQLCYGRGRATMDFLELLGVEPQRMRLSQAAAFEPLTTRLEAKWQNENNCVEIYLLNEVADSLPGTERGGGTKQPAAPTEPAAATSGEQAGH